MTPTNGTAAGPGWRIIGLFWDREYPRWVAGTPDRPDQQLGLHPGLRVNLALEGPRGCVGRWQAEHGRRLWCPTPVPAGTDAQCPGCAANDRGRLLARDAHIDDRDYLLYLAWFGPGLVKVGLSAAERGHGRLMEQGALAYTELGRGPLPAVRAAERAIAGAGHATERLRLERKLQALWQAASFTDGPAALKQARDRIAQAGLLDLLRQAPETVHENAATFGLTGPMPRSYEALTGVATPAALVMVLRAVVGKTLIGTDPHTDQPLVVDTRLLAGYHPGPAPDRSRALHTRTRTRPSGGDNDQISLF